MQIKWKDAMNKSSVDIWRLSWFWRLLNFFLNIGIIVKFCFKVAGLLRKSIEALRHYFGSLLWIDLPLTYRFVYIWMTNLHILSLKSSRIYASNIHEKFNKGAFRRTGNNVVSNSQPQTTGAGTCRSKLERVHTTNSILYLVDPKR